MSLTKLQRSFTRKLACYGIVCLVERGEYIVISKVDFHKKKRLDDSKFGYTNL